MPRVASAGPSDDAALAPASARPRACPTADDLAIREAGLLFPILALIALRLLYDRVHAAPPNDPAMVEFALGLLTFIPASFGAAALWFGEELFR